jgi:hypothetical protein
VAANLLYGNRSNDMCLSVAAGVPYVTRLLRGAVLQAWV